MDVLEPEGMVTADDALIGAIAGEIRALNLLHGVPWARAIGELVLDKFFHKDVELYRSRSKKHVSLRALGKRKDLGISRYTLGRAIGVAIMCRNLPRKIASELELQQGYALLQVPEDQVRKAAERAVEDRLAPEVIAAEFPNPEKKPKGKAETPFGTTMRSAKRHIAALSRNAASYAVTAKPAKVASTRRDLLAMRAEIDAALESLPDDAEPFDDGG